MPSHLEFRDFPEHWKLYFCDKILKFTRYYTALLSTYQNLQQRMLPSRATY
jgi:hypothetical protein